MAGHPFDEAIALHPTEPGWFRGQTSADWANMVGPFGGMTAAVLLHAIEKHPDRIGEPVALTVNFAAPVADGVFDIATRAVRTNRTNQHWVAEMWQDGVVTTNATAVFGSRRDTWSDAERRPPSAPAPEDLPSTGLPEVIVWSRNYDMRFVDGPPPAPGTGPAAASDTALWVRDRDHRPLDFPALAAVSDVFYPRVFRRLGAATPAGTISLTTYFHATGSELSDVAGDFVLAGARANRFSRGYFDQSAELWSRAGELLATSHQLVYFKT